MRAWLICCGLAFLSGCGLLWDDPYIQVQENPLNWIEIHYYNATREPIRRVNVRLTGAGEVFTKSGTARLVSDDFAKDIAGDSVSNYRENRYNVPASHMRQVFQELVNGGILDRDKMDTKTKYPSQGRFIVCQLAIDNKTYSYRDNLFEEDPDLAERLYNVVLEFNRPVLGKRRGGASPKP